jgi:hypothetical protein
MYALNVYVTNNYINFWSLKVLKNTVLVLIILDSDKDCATSTKSDHRGHGVKFYKNSSFFFNL